MGLLMARNKNASGIITVALPRSLPNDVSEMILGRELDENHAWMPMIEFSWRILGGPVVTVAVALCSKSLAPTIRPGDPCEIENAARGVKAEYLALQFSRARATCRTGGSGLEKFRIFSLAGFGFTPHNPCA
jgi:hypothetical protein